MALYSGRPEHNKPSTAASASSPTIPLAAPTFGEHPHLALNRRRQYQQQHGGGDAAPRVAAAEAKRAKRAENRDVINHLLTKWSKTDHIPAEDLALLDMDEVEELFDSRQNEEGLVSDDEQLVAHYRALHEAVKADHTLEESFGIDGHLDYMMKQAGVTKALPPIVLPSLVARDSPMMQPPPPPAPKPAAASASSKAAAAGKPSKAKAPPSPQNIPTAAREQLMPFELPFGSYTRDELRHDLSASQFLRHPQLFNDVNSIKNLHQHLVKLRCWRRGVPGRQLVGREAIERWQIEMRRYTGELVDTKKAGDRVAFVYYVERPVFVYCVFEETTDDGEQNVLKLEWLGHFFVEQALPAAPMQTQ